MDYPHTSFYHYRGAAYHKRADLSPAGIFVPHIMIAFLRRLNAGFISLALFFVYIIGIGVARLMYILSATKNNNRDSYWRPASKTQTADELTTPY